VCVEVTPTRNEDRHANIRVPPNNSDHVPHQHDFSMNRTLAATGRPVTVESLAIIGLVDSTLTDVADAPHQPDEHGATSACLRIADPYRAGIGGVSVGDEIIVLTWLHLANRATLTVHPRGDFARPVTGVFSTRSQHRPNPIGLHRTTVTGITPHGLDVRPLEAISGTPILDIKPVIGPPDYR
jgi:tRNA-Thr(GGU) m(6)t(6)A37 methyltransferase TsaA